MFVALQVATLLFVAIAMGTALAHALELPGKLRLSKDEYLAVQTIYYPGFTFGGAAEPIALILLIALMFMTPAGAAFWLTAAAFAALAAAHATYWLLTHPLNSFWLKDVKLKGAGASFFAVDLVGRGGGDDWTALRDRWESSHVVRAALTIAGLILTAAAIAI
jgi:hypothetical protein